MQNIVIIFAENRSFDGLFGNFPGANGLNNAAVSGAAGAGGSGPAYVPQKDRDGTVLAKLPQTWGGATAAGNPTVVTQAQTDNLLNAPFPLETTFMTVNGAPALTTLDVTRDMAHRFFENMMELNGGTNDMFAAWEDAGGITMGHWDYSKSKLWALAQQYVLADNFFMGAFGGSFLTHQYLICACAPGRLGGLGRQQQAVRQRARHTERQGRSAARTGGDLACFGADGPAGPADGQHRAPRLFRGRRRVPRRQHDAAALSAERKLSGRRARPTCDYADPGAANTLPVQTQTTIGIFSPPRRSTGLGTRRIGTPPRWTVRLPMARRTR